MLMKLFEIAFLLICSFAALALALPCFITGGGPFPDLTLDADLPLGITMAVLGIGLFGLALKWTWNGLRR